MIPRNKHRASKEELSTGNKVVLVLLLIGAILFIASIAIWLDGNAKAGAITMWTSAVPLGIGLVVQLFINIDAPDRDLR